ncbi:hypothetical protein OAT18_03485 [Tenacibaculum sp.]|nr:hypothetical protein [Tenacibaculum sp.]
MPKTYKETRASKAQYLLRNSDFMCWKYNRWAASLLGGGISLVLTLIFIFPLNETRDDADWIFLVITALSTLLFILYGITMPKKEHILNRRDSLITMTGFMWQPNITMDFNKIEFAYSTGGENGVGGFMLQTIRPNKWQTFDTFIISGGDCYEDMSFITWYMDKNRPLPPKKVFDEFREVDYQRRKAAGFPKPLFPSAIKTPEATKEQQAERKRIGGW